MSFDFDILIVSMFLITTMVVGLGHGKKVKNIKDYALGGRNFSLRLCPPQQVLINKTCSFKYSPIFINNNSLSLSLFFNNSSYIVSLLYILLLK